MQMSTENTVNGTIETQVTPGRPGLKKIPPYWYPYRTNAKARWFDREILEVISTEFRDRSVEYYRYALQCGVTTINGKIARPGMLVRNGDTLENIVHRHEPPVTSTPVEILHHDIDQDFIVINKPGSIPVHAAGRYFKNSLVEILKNDFGFPNVYTVNRLDRLTSGLMIIALSADRARSLTAEFASGTIQKEYVARVRGEFPEEETICEEPLLTVDRQMGLNVVHPEGKEAKTIFKRMHYDKATDTSVVHCRPVTGRSHQIRVHLQYLGHPIANDAVYGDPKIWGPRVGKGGIDILPSEERQAPRPPPGLEDSTAEGQVRFQVGEATVSNETEPKPSREEIKPSERTPPTCNSSRRLSGPELKMKKRNERRLNPAYRTKEESAALTADYKEEEPTPGMLPRETGHDIGLGSPVPLSSEAVDIITRLRNQKDEDEDWGRWRDVVFRAKGALTPRAKELAYAEQHTAPKKAGKKKITKGKGRKDDRDGRGSNEDTPDPDPDAVAVADSLPVLSGASSTSVSREQEISNTAPEPRPTDSSSNHVPALLDTDLRTEQTQVHDIIADENAPSTTEEASTADLNSSTDDLYCPECYVPLHPDPKPEKLYIFLHALRYTSASLGAFETRLPEWAAQGYTWE